jgi:hypothetical protein
LARVGPDGDAREVKVKPLGEGDAEYKYRTVSAGNALAIRVDEQGNPKLDEPMLGIVMFTVSSSMINIMSN